MPRFSVASLCLSHETSIHKPTTVVNLTWCRSLCIILAMAALTIAKITCLRCAHQWYPRSPELPRLCPKCTSAYWDTPRRAKAKLENDTGGVPLGGGQRA